MGIIMMLLPILAFGSLQESYANRLMLEHFIYIHFKNYLTLIIVFSFDSSSP